MTRTSESKRAPLPRTSDHAKPFRKDWERLSRTGRHDMRLLREAMMLIVANEGPLPPEWKDHPLKGGWSGHRECRVGGDFLLIYELKDDGRHDGRQGGVVFERIGTHAELFNE